MLKSGFFNNLFLHFCLSSVTCTLYNCYSSQTTEIKHVLSSGVPDRPEELEVTKVTKDLISVTWKAPKFDGGSEITMYILEARMIGKDKYTRLTKEKLMERKYTFDGLREGDTYEFRVIAVNEVGPSKPSFSTKPITCRDELGEDFLLTGPFCVFI